MATEEPTKILGTEINEGFSSTIADNNSGTKIVENLDDINKKTQNVQSIIKSINELTKNNSQEIANCVATLAPKINDIKALADKIRDDGISSSEKNVTMFLNDFKQSLDTIKNALNSNDIAKAVQDGIQAGLSSQGNTTNNIDDVKGLLSNATIELNNITSAIDGINTNLAEAADNVSKIDANANKLSQNSINSSASVMAGQEEAKKLVKNTTDTIEAQQATLKSLVDNLSHVDKLTNNSSEFIDSVLNNLTTVSLTGLAEKILELSNKTSEALTQENSDSKTLNGLTSMSKDMETTMHTLLDSVKNSGMQRKVANHMLDYLSNAKTMLESQMNVIGFHIGHEADDKIKQDLSAQLHIVKGMVNDFSKSIQDSEALIATRLAKTLNEEAQRDLGDFSRVNNGGALTNSVDFSLAASQYGSIPGGFNSGLEGATSSVEGFGERKYGLLDSIKRTYYNGRILGPTDALRENLINMQRVGMLSQMRSSSWTDALSYAKQHQDKSIAFNAMHGLAGITSANADAVLQTADKMNLSTGGGKNLPAADKKVLDGFIKSVDSALKNVNASILAMQELHMDEDSIAKLKDQSKHLSEIKNKINDIKDKSSTWADIVGGLWSGFKKFRNFLAGGLGALGLGSLLNAGQFISKSVGYEEQEGQRRYTMIKNDFAMGASPNSGRMIDIARNMGDEYFELSNGQIDFGAPTNYYTNLVHNVGGHYGESQNSAANDLQAITHNTFAIGKLYDISDSTMASAMKVFYKDLRMSATEASYTLSSLAQTATTANVPVEKYVQIVTNMADSLRSSGVDGRQVVRSMNGLMSRNMRVEDAQDLVTGMANMNQNMARDYNASAYFGMAAGQGGSVFGNITAGLLSHNSKGDPNPDYYNMMGERIMAEANMYGIMGGGAGTDTGLMLMMDSLRRRGASQRQASEIGDAARKGDTSLVANLLKEVDEQKDGGAPALAEATVDAKEKLKLAYDQVAITTKIEKDMAMAEKGVGEAINKYLTGPLEIFNKGFKNALDTIVDKIKDFAGGLNKILSSRAGQAVTETAANNPGTTLLAGVGALTAAAAAGYMAKNRAGKFLNERVFSNPRVVSGASHLSNVARVGSALLAAGVVVGGAYSVYKLLSNGDAKTQVSNIPEGGNFDDIKKEMESSGWKPHGSDLDTTPDADSENGSDENNPNGQNTTLNDVQNHIVNNWDNDFTITDKNRPTDNSALSQGMEVGGAGLFSGVYSYFANRGQKDNNFSTSAGFDLLGGLKGGGEGLLKRNAITGGAISVLEEGVDAYMHPDRFSGGERLARTALDMLGTVGGGVAGGALGSFFGPAGTFIGGVGGSMAGQYLANKAKGALGISDEDGAKREQDRYDSIMEESNAKYEDATNDLMDSNNDRSKAAELALHEHGTKLENLSTKQQEYMDGLFSQLKNLGLNDVVAAYLAGNRTAQVQAKADNDAVAAKNDDATKGIYMHEKANETDSFAKEAQYDLAGDYYTNSQNDDYWDSDALKAQYAEYDETNTGSEQQDAINSAMQDALKDFKKEYYRNKNVSARDQFSTFSEMANTPGANKEFARYMAYHGYSDLGGDTGMVAWGRNHFSQTAVDNLNDGSGSEAGKAAGDLAKGAGHNNPAQVNLRQKIMDLTTKQIGKDYQWGAAGPDAFDCSGLTQYVFGQNGINMAHDADAQANMFKGLNMDKSKAHAGDLIFYRGFSGDIEHVGVADGQGGMVAAPGTGQKVKHQDIFDKSGDLTFAGFGNVSELGVNGNATYDSSNDSKGTDPNSPLDSYHGVLEQRNKILSQFAAQSGLSNEEFMKDKVATGQLIIDGTTALSANGRQMSLGGVRRNFILNSGEHDFDRFGYGLGGAISYDPTTHTYRQEGSMNEITKQIEATVGKYDSGKYHELTHESALNKQDEHARQLEAISRDNKDVYLYGKQTQEEVNEQIEKSKDTAENQDKAVINISVIDKSTGSKSDRFIQELVDTKKIANTANSKIDVYAAKLQEVISNIYNS